MSASHATAEERLHIKRWVSEQEQRAHAWAASESRRHVGAMRIAEQVRSKEALALLIEYGLKIPVRSHDG